LSLTHDAEAAFGPLDRLMRLGILRQFIKFCLIGATSTGIHLGTYYYFLNVLLRHGVPAWISALSLPGWLSPKDLYMQLAYSLGFCLAVTNGFVWNRLWTFKGEHRRGTRTQYLLFFLVNIVGMAMSSTIVFVVVNLLQHWGYSEILARKVAPLVALAPVAVWNFTANRFWTFAAPPADS
jgi:putative flippase GtrA